VSERQGGVVNESGVSRANALSQQPLQGCGMVMQSPDLAVLRGLLHNPVLGNKEGPLLLAAYTGWSARGHGIHFPAGMDN